jgi:hypothetical protein
MRHEIGIETGLMNGLPAAATVLQNLRGTHIWQPAFDYPDYL